MERLFFFVIAVALAFGVGCLGRKHQMSLKRKTKLKIWGWVCILIGVISFISIIMRGNPNLGPSVWVAIGVYLLYRKNT